MARRFSKLAARCSLLLAASAGTLGLILAVYPSWAHSDYNQGSQEPPLQSLKRVKLPLPKDLDQYVADRESAIALGKALFWDVKLSSDNKIACASCHFHAGADDRLKNQISPGLLAGDKTFQLGGAPNYLITAADFPLTRFANVDDPSSIVSDINDIVGSSGVFTKNFNASGAVGASDNCTAVSDAVSHGGSGFNVNGVNTRRVEPRHAPTVFNSIFNFRNFWDGRANNVFNGFDPFGLRNATATIWKVQNGSLQQVQVVIEPGSNASQGVGPQVSENEMSCKGRMLADVGRKLLPLAPLSTQTIDPYDSVLGGLASCGNGHGGSYGSYGSSYGGSYGKCQTYADLVKRSFKRAYWSSDTRIDLRGQNPGSMDLPASTNLNNVPFRSGPPALFTQIEANFGFFMGMALQLYQSTLVSDDTPFDRYAEGNRYALNSAQKRGLALFNGKANCVHCHVGAEFTSATFGNLMEEGRLDSRAGAGGQTFRYDNGFFNTGVRPTPDDPGVGGFDPFGYPLSETRIDQMGRIDLLGPSFDVNKETPVPPGANLAVDGAFKTPGLRNVELTGPYFHNGGKATLMQVVDFYNRGGDFGAQNAPVTDPVITQLGLTEDEKRDLVAFLLALTDERVRFEKAPFDHPSICVPDGHQGNTTSVAVDANGDAVDLLRCIPAVGSRGRRTALAPFLSLSPYQH